MPNVADFPAAGRVLLTDADSLVFQPANSTYELKLIVGSKYDGPLNQRIQCLIRVNARKVYTVPSGGNFISPIFGPPRIIQGRIKYLEETVMVLQAGTSIVVELPHADSAFDLVNGPLAVGVLANVVALPGARIELVQLQAVGQ
jgi:hypothetical protein